MMEETGDWEYILRERIEGYIEEIKSDGALREIFDKEGFPFENENTLLEFSLKLDDILSRYRKFSGFLELLKLYNEHFSDPMYQDLEKEFEMGLDSVKDCLFRK